MSEGTIICLFWLLGWIILSVSHFIYKVYIDKDHKVNKKIHAWRAFWIGMWSWLGIFFVSAFLIVGGICLFNEWIEDKLKR